MPADATAAVGAAAVNGPMHVGSAAPAQSAPQEGNIVAPALDEVGALHALQKQLDVAQDRLSNEQKRSVHRLDSLLQNMLVRPPDCVSLCVS